MGKKNYDSLVKVTADSEQKEESASIILSETLLQYSQKIAPDFYSIDNLSGISDQFAKEENIYILAHEVNSDFPAHTHRFYEMTYVCRGGIQNRVDGKAFYMGEGDLSILNPLAVQEIGCTSKDTLLINLCLKREFFDRTLHCFYQDNNVIAAFLRNERGSGRNYMRFSLGSYLPIQTVISSIVEEYAASGFRQSFGLEALILLLFSKLIRMHEPGNYGMDAHTLEMVQYLQSHCLDQNLSQMAAAIGYNSDYLTAYLKKHAGRNCKAIIREARLKEAVVRLAETDRTIAEIAEECGYQSVSHFHRVFRETYHMTPNEYRNNKYG